VTLNTHLNDILGHLLSIQNNQISKKTLISCIDLTLLAEDASSEDLKTLNVQATQNQVAAVCVYPHQLASFQSLSGVRLATVVNFPHGNDAVPTSLDLIEQAIQNKAIEIDYVLPYKDYLSGHKQRALNHCQSISKLCASHNVQLKIILETGAFLEMESIYAVSKELINIGCDFIKTSTGKITQGASLAAAAAILSAIKDSGSTCGIKISGGIKTTVQAQSYAYLAEFVLEKTINKQWFRIGASTLLQELLV
jgi:deoxyribose-phosphate aldolase